MSEPKSKATSTPTDQANDGLQNFYFPEANDGLGGTVRAKDRDAADKLAADGKFVNLSEAPATDAGEDKAE